jgi:putative SbcD/Mre11-related phosphoesterase
MKIKNFETVDSLPCLYHKELDMLVMSDLHLGLEGSMTYQGSYVPEFQLEEIKEDVQHAQELTDADRILLNGDLKHEFKYTCFSEKKEIKDFMEMLEDLFSEVILIEGNHDSHLDEVIKGAKIQFKDSHLEERILFIHGHTAMKNYDAENYDTIVIGHEHPALELKDDVGFTEKIDCFLYGETNTGKNLVVLPAFSKISGGSAVNNTPKKQLLSPVLRNEVKKSSLKALGVSKEAGLFEFPEIGKL